MKNHRRKATHWGIKKNAITILYSLTRAINGVPKAYKVIDVDHTVHAFKYGNKFGHVAHKAHGMGIILLVFYYEKQTWLSFF